MSIRARVFLGFASICALLVVTVLISSRIVGDIHGRMERIGKLRVPTALTSLRLNINIENASAALRGWVVTGERRFKNTHDAVWSEIDALVARMDELSQRWNEPERADEWARCKRLLGELESAQERVESVAHNADAQPAMQRFRTEGTELNDKLYWAVSSMIDIEKQLEGSPLRKTIFGYMADLRGSLSFARAGLNTYLLTGDVTYRHEYETLLAVAGENLAKLRRAAAQLTPEQRQLLSEYETAYRKLERLDRESIAARKSGTWDMADHLFATEVTPLKNAVLDILSGTTRADGTRNGGMVGAVSRMLERAQAETSNQVAFLSYTTWGLLAAGLVLTVIIGWLAARSITVPVGRLVSTIAAMARGDTKVQVPGSRSGDELGRIAGGLEVMARAMTSVTETCEAISVGDLTRKVKVRSDKDQLALAVNRMVDTFQEIVVQANAISQGDYRRTIEIRSDRDELGRALVDMTAALRRAAETNQRDAWLRTGQREVIEAMQGEGDVPGLARAVISTLARYLDAQVGVIYVSDDEGALRLMSSYAHLRRKQLQAQVRPGDGLVGQAFLEKQPIVVSEVPEDYIYIDSGLGSAPPRNLAVIPLITSREVRGVVELGKVQPFSETELQLFELVSENIAISLASAQHLVRTQELLEKTQQQSDMMLKQSEELRAANEELEEQTARLEQSREELKTQSEELKATNEELEEKTELLKRQKQDMEEKNANLEQARQELADKARELEQTSRYKSEFLANMSHELRTPLNSLLILSKLLAENDEGNLTEEQVSAANVIYSGGKDLLELINDILDLSKVEAGMLETNLEDVRLDTLANRLQMHFEPVANEAGVDFQIAIDPGMPEALSTDRMRLEQVLRNLLGNAFKFTSEGSVRLRIGRPEPGVELRRIQAPADEVVAFAVTDTGIGIPESKQQEIFEAFQQVDGSTSRKYGGTGLGLTISREIARLLGGEILIRSRPGEGSAFTFYLPERAPAPAAADQAGAVARAKEASGVATGGSTPAAASPPAPAARPAQLPARDVGGHAVDDDRHDLREGDRIILIIEDDPAFASTLCRLCRDREYKCVIAGDGVTGLRMAGELQPTAIFLDLILPDLDGMLVLEQLKFDLSTRHIPVHIISAREAGTGAMQRGAIGCLRKPVSLEDISALLAKVEEHLAAQVKSVLIIEDSRSEQDAITRLIDHDDIDIHTVTTGKEALTALATESFDCVILDLQLPDMSGFEVLRSLREDDARDLPPIIVYTGRELTRKEHLELSQYTQSIVIKGANSPERLLDEASLFLHSMESSLPPTQRKMIRMLHDPDQVLRGRKVLLVDDNLRNAFALSGVLKKYGVDVVLADNGQLALEKLATEDGIELILMDIMMPIMDGYETMRRIRSDPRFASIPIVALTAKAMAEDRAKCLEAGANDYLTKPVDTDQLISLIRVWLFGRHAHR